MTNPTSAPLMLSFLRTVQCAARASATSPRFFDGMRAAKGDGMHITLHARSPRQLMLLATLVSLLSGPAVGHAQDTPYEEEDVEETVDEPAADDPQLGNRVLAELGFGIGMLCSAGTVGGGLGALIGSSFHDGSYLGGTFLGGAVGLGALGLIALPAAIGLAGSWNDGRGDVWAAYVGEAIGIALAAVVLGTTWALDRDPGTSDDVIRVMPYLAVASIALPLIGAFAGYEISDDVNRGHGPEAHGEPSGVQALPIAAPTADGTGAVVGAVGVF
jgi:hypothetical protein